MKLLSPEMLEVTELTQAGRLNEATALIQKILGGQHAEPTQNTEHALTPPTLDLTAEDVTPTPKASSAIPESHTRASPGGKRRARVFDALRKAPLQHPRQWPQSDLHPPNGTFLNKSFQNQAGQRNYKLYIPSDVASEPRPLIIMLHGCTQSADDFAAGTRMNFAAENRSCYVAYPEQTQGANPSRCWNWFEKGHQQRGRGEPSIIAGMLENIIGENNIDKSRVYIAGLSAGGATAAVMADLYPDMFAAVGVHSGLPCGVAQDLPSAFAAMKGGAAKTAMPKMPTIVFHGDRDTTVHPNNGKAVAQGAASHASYQKAVEAGHVENGRRYSRVVYSDEAGKVFVEDWIIHDAGHAWSGGSKNGSFTDPLGPNATEELLRFFLDHKRPA